MSAKVAVITGGASGIGEATARHLARRGIVVTLLDLRAQPLVEAVTRMPSTAPAVHTHVADVTDADACAAAVGQVVERHGRIDMLVNSAGLPGITPFLETSADEFDRLFRVNVGGVWNMCQAAAPSLLEHGGSIVNIASVAALRGGGVYGTAAYAASKGAVVSLTKSLARELAPKVRCNAVCPSLTLTPMGRGVVEEKGGVERVLEMTPLGRAGDPDEVGAVAAFLASGDASYVTGQIWAADGGVVI